MISQPELSTAEEHKIGDYVVYRQDGICRIYDIKSEDFCCMGEKKYYSLISVFNEKNKIYVPVGSKIADEMHRLLTADEIEDVIKESETNEENWISDGRERATFFDSVIKSGNRTQILKIFKLLSLRKLELEAQKKKLHANDERILSVVQKQIIEEFSFVLSIPQNEVVSFIIDEIKKYKS